MPRVAEAGHDGRIRRGRRVMPHLTVVIGGNGAGKTTWTRDRENRATLRGPFYNADTLAEGLGDWNDPKRQREARKIVDENIAERLKLREDFGFESTYSGSSRPEIIRRAKQAGYTVEAVFVGTNKPDINVRRVAIRAAEGTGHSVAESEIRRRWQAAQDNLVKTCRSIDIISIIDNSRDGSKRLSAPALRIKNDRVVGENSRLPAWIEKLKAQMNPEPQYVHRQERREYTPGQNRGQTR